MKNKTKKWSIIALVFFICVIIVTFPAIINLDNSVIGSMDSPGMGGELFLLAHTVMKFQNMDYLNFYHTELSSYPMGENLKIHIGFPIHLILYPILFRYFGLFGSYNIVIILFLTLNGISCCFFLVRRGISLPMALVGSIYFMLSPYFLLKLQLGFPSKLIFFWCPLFLDAILMLRKTGKIKYITLAFLYLVGCLLGYPQYVIYLLTTVIVMVLWDMFSREGRNRNLKTFVVILLFTPAAVIFFFYVHVGESPLFMLPSLDPTKYPSVDIFHFWRFFPVTYAPGVNKALPIGIPFIIFLLLIPGILRSKEEIQPLVVSAVVLLILSMGPILQTDFRAVDFFGSKILLPFYLFTSFGPMRSRIGFPVRALPLAILCMMPVVLLLLEDFKSQRNLLIKRIIPYILMFILIMETVISLPELYSDITTPVDVPEFFSEIMKDNGAVIHLPFEKPEPPHCYSILTAMSMHPQVNPLRPDPSIYNPLFKLYLLIHGFTEKHEIVLYCEELRKQGIRYIAVHRTLYSDLQKLTELENLLSIAFGNPYFSESSNIKIYTIPNPPK